MILPRGSFQQHDKHYTPCNLYFYRQVPFQRLPNRVIYHYYTLRTFRALPKNISGLPNME